MDLWLLFINFCGFIKIINCDTETTLRLVHALFRHGDRSPTSTFPSDPYGEEKWQNGFGQLTKIGMEQAYNLGVFFRERYVNTIYPGYLTTDYSRKQIYTLSTDTDRTLNTAYCMLAGLYPPTVSHQWGQTDVAARDLGSLWQPIPVRSLEYGTDPMLCTDVHCHRYDHLANKILKSKRISEIEKSHEELIKYVAKNGGWKKATLQNAWDTYDPLFCMKQHELHLNWATEETLIGLAHLKLHKYNCMFEDKTMHKLRAGTFLHELLNNTKYAVHKKIDPERKINFYSSHDTMLAAVLYALEVWNEIFPPYTAALIFELHESPPGHYYVDVLYRNHTHENPNGPYPLPLPGCGVHCPWEKFEKLLSPLVLENFHEACANLKGQSVSLDAPMSTGGKVALVLFCITATACVAATSVWCYRKRKRDFQYSSANFTDVTDVVS